MDTLMKAKATRRDGGWRDRIVSGLFLCCLLWAAVTVIFSLSSEPAVSSANAITAEPYATEQVTRQELAERYRDPELTYFFGE